MEQGKKCFEYGENKNDGKLKSEGGGKMLLHPIFVRSMLVFI